MKRWVFFLFFLLSSPEIALTDILQDTPQDKEARERMVLDQIRLRGISDPAVLGAVGAVARHFFVPKNLVRKAYADHPLPIGEGQTISQPYIVALMTESLGLGPNDRVLEIGTGSGYQAAVLSKIAGEVYTIEIKESLYKKASALLRSAGFGRVKVRHGDGYFGWTEAAPFDAVMITAAVDHIPPPLLGQMKDGGRLVLPLGNPFSYQNLVLVVKNGENYTVKEITGVLFVPLTGHALDPNKH